MPNRNSDVYPTFFTCVCVCDFFFFKCNILNIKILNFLLAHFNSFFNTCFSSSSINAKQKFWGVPLLFHMCLIFEKHKICSKHAKSLKVLQWKSVLLFNFILFFYNVISLNKAPVKSFSWWILWFITFSCDL